MLEYPEWLNKKCIDEPLTIPISKYNFSLNNEYIKIYYRNKVFIGKVINNISDDLYLVKINNKFFEIYLIDYECYVINNVLTNYEFCEKQALKILNYINNCEDISLKYKKEKFINDFCYFVYINSKY